MSIRQPLNRIVEVLAATFDDLVAWQQIYTAPRVTPVKSPFPLELQVCESGMEVIGRDNNLRREQYGVSIGLLRTSRLDHEGRYYESLKDAAESIFEVREQIIDTLDGNFLRKSGGGSELLIRPLVLQGETSVRAFENIPGLQIKEIRFTGGLNYALV